MENKYVEMRCELSAPLAMEQELPAGIGMAPLWEVDEETLYTCYHSAFSTGDAAFFFAQREEERREFFDELELRQALRQSASSALLKGDALVGFTYVLRCGEGNLHISCMCVHPDYKRQGLGKFMLQHAQRQARADGYRSITLGTDTLMGAFQLYAQNGFKVVANENIVTSKNEEKQFSGVLGVIVRFFQIALYVVLQMVFIPFAIVGLIIGLYKEVGNSKKLGVSFSAGQALQYRWFMHYLETRPDSLSVEFTKKFPCESHFALWTIMGALILSLRLFGFRTKLSEVAEPEEADLAAISGVRVVAFDRIMEKYVDIMDQIVILGSGFDLIALHFTKGKKVRVFELDQLNTLNIKLETLEKAGIAHDWITYIPVDYENESWVNKLQEDGFEKGKKTLFLWQSVSLYLDADVVRETIREIGYLCTDGSIIAQDFYSEAYSLGKYSFVAKRNMELIEKMGEPAKFGIDMSGDPKTAVENFLKECGLKMTEFIRFGENLDIEPFYCIVEAERC